MRLGARLWALRVLRASDVPDCPEKRLLAQIVANAIADEEASAYGFCKGWFTDALKRYCKALGVDPMDMQAQVWRVRAMSGPVR